MYEIVSGIKLIISQKIMAQIYQDLCFFVISHRLRMLCCPVAHSIVRGPELDRVIVAASGENNASRVHLDKTLLIQHIQLHVQQTTPTIKLRRRSLSCACMQMQAWRFVCTASNRRLRLCSSFRSPPKERTRSLNLWSEVAARTRTDANVFVLERGDSSSSTPTSTLWGCRECERWWKLQR